MRLAFTFFVLFFSTLLVSCGDGSNNSADDTSSLMGAWKYKYADPQCDEAWFFNGDGTFEVNNAAKVYSGTYSYDNDEPEVQRHALNITINADNGQADCSGLSFDTTGLSQTLYVEFPSASELAWYDAPTEGALFLSMEAFLGSPNSIRSQVDAGDDGQYYEGDEITLMGSSDLLNISSVQWTQTSGPAAELGAASDFTLTFTLPVVSANDVISLQMAIRLDNGEQLYDSVNIEVLDYL